MKKNIGSVTDERLAKMLIAQFVNHVTLEQFAELTQYQYSNNSLLAMVKDWNLFVSFCQHKHVCPIPASTTAVRLFIEQESKHRKYATIRRYAVTIGVIHRILTSNDPTNHAQVRLSLSKLRVDKHGDAKQAQSFEYKHLINLDSILHHSHQTKDIRDLAICHVMFECALKRSELKQLLIDDVTLDASNNASFIIKDATYHASELASKRIVRWLTLVGPVTGPLFRSVDRHNNIGINAMDDSSIYRVMRSVGERIGDGVEFSGQSIRVGAVKELAKQGYKAKDIQTFGRWLSPAMPYQYLGNLGQAETEQLKYKTIKSWD